MVERQLRLRPEARGVEIEHLHRDQRRAVESLVDLLHAATRDLPSESNWATGTNALTARDENRTSRVIFLGGDRGSGKTTVARTLCRELNARRGTIGPDRDTERTGDPENATKAAIRTLRDQINHVGERVILLEPLDMENAPAETNILAALLARIEQQLFPDLSHDDVGSTSGQPQQHQAVLELLRLQTDVAIAWNGNLGARKGNLDPDNYAMEELRVERVRLQLRDRFATVLRRTARDSLGYQRPAMFVLIVDDVDLNPDQVIDLVDRLRMVGVAELAVIMIGDMHVMETVFRLHFAQRFRMGGSAGDAGVEQDDMQAMTNRLAQSALRKHVPYHQRVQLQRMAPADALDLKPLADATGDVPADAPALRDLLANDTLNILWPQPDLATGAAAPATADAPDGVPSEQPVSLSLLEFIRPPLAEAEGASSWYTGSRTLSDFPRVIVDFWNAAFDAIHRRGLDTSEPEVGKIDRRLLKLLGELAVERIEESTLPPQLRERVSDMDLRRRVAEDGDLGELNIDIRHAVSADSETWAGQFPLDSPSASTLVWVRHGGFTYSGLAATGRGPDLDQRDIGPAVLVEDLWATQVPAPSSESICARNRDHLEWVVEGRLDDGGNLTERAARWEIPRYRTVRQMEQFGYLWNNFLSAHTDDPVPADLALAWIVIHTETLNGERPMTFDHTTGRLDSRLPAVGHALGRAADVADFGLNRWQQATAADWLATVGTLCERHLVSDTRNPATGGRLTTYFANNPI